MIHQPARVQMSMPAVAFAVCGSFVLGLGLSKLGGLLAIDVGSIDFGMILACSAMIAIFLLVAGLNVWNASSLKAMSPEERVREKATSLRLDPETW